MDARRAWLLGLGLVGTGSVLYAVVARGFVAPGERPGQGLGWPVLGVLPLLVLGLWLLTATSSRVALYLALAGTATAVGSAYETLLWTHPELLSSSALPLLNTVGLTADGLSAASFLLLLGTFPDGALQRRWQRLALRPVWACAAVGVVGLLTTDAVVLPRYVGLTTDMPNPYVVPALQGLEPLFWQLLDAWVPTLIAVVVLLSRALGGDGVTRQRVRVMAFAVAFLMSSWVLWSAVPVLDLEGTPLAVLLQAAVFVGMLGLLVAGIHGIFRYGAFDVAEPDRGRVVLQSASALITLLYGVATAAPALLLLDRLQPLGAVIVTVVTAVILLPLRSLAQGAVRRAVLGDRDHHLELLSDLGVRLEQALDLEDVLARIAQGVRRGLDASWVRVRVRGADGSLGDAPVGVAGTVAGAPVARQELLRGQDRLGILEVGPGRHGDYTPGELALLGTVARQATTAVANVRLTARLGEKVHELAASRERLVGAQEEERRRIERDLHDGVQQGVVALIAGLGRSRQRLARGGLEAADLVELQEQARDLLTDLRELAQGIHPQVLTDRGVVAAVESRTSRFPLALAVVADEAVRHRRFSPELEAVAYYSVSEALVNVAKHSGASCVRVVLSLRDDRLRLEVVDDGHGLAPGDTASPGGLTHIRDRVAVVGGRLDVESAPATGTRLVVELPVNPPPLPSPTPSGDRPVELPPAPGLDVEPARA